MTTITTMILITLTMTLAMVPRIYWSFLKAEELVLEREKMREFRAQRAWVLRHVRCSLVSLVFVWAAMTFTGLAVPGALAAAVAIYAASSLLFVILESMLAQKIDDILASVSVRVNARD